MSTPKYTTGDLVMVVGGKYKGKKAKSSKHRESKLTLRKEQFDLICQKFDFKITLVLFFFV